MARMRRRKTYEHAVKKRQTKRVRRHVKNCLRELDLDQIDAVPYKADPWSWD